MFEPSWFIAGNVAVSRMNGFDMTLIGDTYAEAEGGVCELVMIVVGVSSIRNNKNRIPTKTFFLFIILRSAVWLKNLNSCLRELRVGLGSDFYRGFNFVLMNPRKGERKIGKSSKWYIEKKCELREKKTTLLRTEPSSSPFAFYIIRYCCFERYDAVCGLENDGGTAIPPP